MVSLEIFRKSRRTGERKKEVAAAAMNIRGSPIMGVAWGHWRPMTMNPPNTTKGRRTLTHPIPAGGTGEIGKVVLARAALAPFRQK